MVFEVKKWNETVAVLIDSLNLNGKAIRVAKRFLVSEFQKSYDFYAIVENNCLPRDLKCFVKFANLKSREFSQTLVFIRSSGIFKTSRPTGTI